MAENEILKDLFFIERGFLNGNHFVYRSDTPVLIDTGYISGFEETEKSITQLGVNLPDISLIISTHTHCDHIGGNNRIQQNSGCDIALHKVGKYFIDSRDDWSTWWRYYNQEAEFFTCTRSLEDGEIITLGPHEFQVLYTPGHASDGIVLYNRQDKILLSSDTLWQTDMAVMTLRVEGSRALFDMQASLHKIENLEVQTVYPGHGKPFYDMPKAIARSKQRIDNFLRNPEAIGDDLLKKIIVYTLMMKKIMPADTLFDYLMDTYWFKETVDLYFKGQYQTKYDAVMNSFLGRGIIKQENNDLYTTAKP
ncbi:MAG: MBL fold metallo-hydrolase [Deltaproteobacteria bacterium]|jgi:glyoxylase-like metal-dependent hydrolase (beta-lactamase superfamily II)|nr:MBL fold metallo-hydrolase [Deltaproteobacteria bacterium]